MDKPEVQKADPSPATPAPYDRKGPKRPVVMEIDGVPVKKPRKPRKKQPLGR